MIERFLAFIDYWVGRLGPQEWIIVAAVAIALGAIWLRGFGSRADY